MTGIFSIATSALAASYAALQTTSHNVANVNTPGYSRQQVQIGSTGGQFTGAGFFGGGVKIDTVTRSYNQFLSAQANVTSAQAAADSARLSQLEQLENVLPPGPRGLGQAAGELLNAFADIATDPQDLSARQVLLGRAQELSARFNDASGQIEQLQAGVAADVRNIVQTVNALTSQVATLNQQIARMQGTGHAPNDLLDQRDQLIAEINNHIQVTTISADDGSIGLFVGGGQQLVLGDRAATLSAVPDEYDRTRVRLAVTDPGGSRKLPTSLLTGGSIAGLMRFQDEDLTAARNLVGQLAAAVAGGVNAQQALGLDLGQPPGAGGAMFGTGAARVLASAGNERQADGNFAASVSIAVQDASQLQASDYELRADPANAGGYLLKRLSDGLTRSVADGDTVDGFTISLSNPTPGAGDRYLLQPVATAAAGMRTVLGDARGIAAAAPFTASADTANNGSASVAAVAMTDAAAADTSLTARITFSNDAGGYDWELLDAGANVVSQGSGQWQAGEAIAINGFELQLDGVPDNGDVVVVEPTRFPAANNGNALALLNLRDAALVGGGLGAAQTVTDAYAQAMADVGVRVQGARSASDSSTALAADAGTRLANATGVDLNEEAARMIQYQQSYQAAAKLLQASQNIFDTLMQAMR